MKKETTVGLKKLTREEMKNVSGGKYPPTCVPDGWGSYMCSLQYGAGYSCIIYGGTTFCSHP